jgi:hypothetical protein
MAIVAELSAVRVDGVGRGDYLPASRPEWLAKMAA